VSGGGARVGDETSVRQGGVARRDSTTRRAGSAGRRGQQLALLAIDSCDIRVFCRGPGILACAAARRASSHGESTRTGQKTGSSPGAAVDGSTSKEAAGWLFCFDEVCAPEVWR